MKHGRHWQQTKQGKKLKPSKKSITILKIFSRPARRAHPDSGVFSFLLITERSVLVFWREAEYYTPSPLGEWRSIIAGNATRQNQRLFRKKIAFLNENSELAPLLGGPTREPKVQKNLPYYKLDPWADHSGLPKLLRTRKCRDLICSIYSHH